ncbi:MAG: tRNA (adenosine(37)-N6)-threonylcarbamoyltransferase complex transferase subunit TsaD [Oscillospiraceae bacterium]|nr:tRNA (adenosine(37)-N6)-threonylcarbamoyltransferase complex transferase subunit TsaD [Oscillospiraceae bacterium]
MTRILGIESSCDETAAAISVDGRTILCDVIASQAEEHKKFGGVVPEVASRRHCENILPTVRSALDRAGLSLSDIDAIAVTYAPGLIGALLVGTSFAKGLAAASGKPLVPVHHHAGHIASNYIAHPELEPPFLCLVASGGHTMIVGVDDYTKYRVIGRTHDDAAGEAFDKCARVMGFPYPGGVYVDRAAAKGYPTMYRLPRPAVEGSEYDFSFSGLKTAVINLVHNAAQKGETLDNDSLAASFQATVAEILTSRTIAAAKAFGYEKVALAGGVAANTGVRTTLKAACDKAGFGFFVPPVSLCGDNGSMIACQGYYDFIAGKRAGADLNALATMPLDSAMQPPCGSAP